jgi:hypothetical protein
MRCHAPLPPAGRQLMLDRGTRCHAPLPPAGQQSLMGGSDSYLANTLGLIHQSSLMRQHLARSARVYIYKMEQVSVSSRTVALALAPRTSLAN